MNRKKIIILLVLLIAAYFYDLFGKMPVTVPFTPQPIANKTSLLLAPLDSRPPCTTMVQKLGQIASIDVILPPKELLDNYNTPAAKEKLFIWLDGQIPLHKTAILSSDLLIHGSLLGSRIPLGQIQDENKFIAFLNQQLLLSDQAQLVVFSVTPRLLVSEHLVPDSWYQWHLMRYTTLKDMVETFVDPYFTNQLQDIESRIPEEIKIKYNNLYKVNDAFNKKLVQLATTSNNLTLVIGQDDSQPFGLPNRNLNHAQAYMKRAHLGVKGQTTSGADEIALLLLTRYYNKLHNYTPKIFVKYSSSKVASMNMPYMPCSVDASIRDKVNFIGGHLTKNSADADFILFVHCGNNDNLPEAEMLKAINHLLTEGKKVALVDLTANYKEEELLLPQMLNKKLPINKLIAFAGWNTLSNSLGSAISQATIFTGQLKQLPASNYPSLYAQNLNFTIERLLDDYAYQKLMHPRLKTLLKLKSYNPTDLGKNKPIAEYLIQGFLQRQKTQFLYGNLGRTPFYQSKNNSYFLTNIALQVHLPWPRIFEINLDITSNFGMSKNCP